MKVATLPSSLVPLAQAFAAKVGAQAIPAPVRRVVRLSQLAENSNSDRTRKPPDKRTDADWARLMAAQEKRQRRHVKNRRTVVEAKVTSGRILLASEIAVLEGDKL